MSMQEQILIALHNSLIGDNATLKLSSQKLSELSRMQGYCISLMEIINQPNLKNDIKQAALIQLKNNVKAKWKPKNPALEITPAEKSRIRDVLVRAIVHCAKEHKLIKLYRQVLTTIIGYEYQTWIPFSQITEIIKTGNNLAPAFHCIIAICTNFEFSIVEKEKNTYNIFLKEMLPIVFETVKNHFSDGQVIYLSLKILWKTVHYQINNDIKVLTNDWMQLLYQVISEINQELQSKLDEIQAKNTIQFYYYHSKKWATRILMRYVQKHAKATTFGKINVQNAEYSKFWYQNYGIKLCEIIVTQLSQGRPTTKKIRYFQLKIIQGIINDKPQLISQFGQLFQQQILLKYMAVTKNDEDQANSDVVEYLRADDQSSMTHSNIKRVATEVWNNFLQLQSRYERDAGIYYPGPNFQRNLNFMFEKIRSDNLIQKEMGMYLFCENRITINRVPDVKKQMPGLIDAYVVPLLENPSVLIRSRANDMIHQYGKQIHDVNILTKCLNGVYACLVQEQSPLVKIKAGIALNSLVWHPQSKMYLKDHLTTILKVYLDIIRQYDLEQVVSALEYFIGEFSQDIGPFAYDLFKCLYQDLFVKMFNKDIQLSQNQEYGSEVELAASGCIKTMTQIIQSPLSPQIRAQIEPLVLQLCKFLFTSQSYDYHEDMFFLLRVHIQKIDRITPQCWFYYQVIIYFIVGIPNDQWNQIQNSPLPEQNKSVLACVREGNNFQFLEFVVPILRNYIGKGHTMILAQKQQFKLNVVHLILYLVVQVYKKGVNVDLEGEIHLDCCSILLIYLLESFPEEMTKGLIVPIWNVCKYNITKGQSSYIKQITSQIIGVLLWKHAAGFLQIIANQNNFPALIKYLTKISLQLQQYQQRKRVILGICQYLLISPSGQILLKNIPALVPILFKLVKKNCVTRIIFNTKNQELKKKFEEMQDNESDYAANSKDDQDQDDMWDQEYNQRHCSVLKNYNELAYFSEVIKKLGAQSPNVFQLIISSMAPQKIQAVEGLLTQAIQLKEK